MSTDGFHLSAIPFQLFAILAPMWLDQGWISHKKYCFQTHYQEDPDSFSKELSEVGTLRSNACIRPTQDFGGIAAVKKYYCQLNFLQNRFKIRGGTEDGIFAFPWFESNFNFFEAHSFTKSLSH